MAANRVCQPTPLITFKFTKKKKDGNNVICEAHLQEKKPLMCAPHLFIFFKGLGGFFAC